jgi:hypothetical protein
VAPIIFNNQTKVKANTEKENAGLLRVTTTHPLLLLNQNGDVKDSGE